MTATYSNKQSKQSKQYHSYAGYLEYVYIQLLVYTDIYSDKVCSNGFNVHTHSETHSDTNTHSNHTNTNANMYYICEAYNLIVTE